ncbi:MAG: DinB family protein [Phycisphaerales bacterium]
MGQIAELTLPAANRVRDNAVALCHGVDPKVAAHRPTFEHDGKPVTIETNHPVFILGHLAIYPPMMLTLLGRDASRVQVPESYTTLFGRGVKSHDARHMPEGLAYPSFDEVRDAFIAGHDAVVAAIPTIDDALLLSNTPKDSRYAERFPKLGQVFQFFMLTHPMLHLGQFSTWRRCMGLGPSVP